MISNEKFKKLKKMPEEYVLIDYRRIFDPQEYEKLKCGLAASSMDEKWTAFFIIISFICIEAGLGTASTASNW